MNLIQTKNYHKIEKLYNELFPENERMDLKEVFAREGNVCFIIEKEEVEGFIILLNYLRISHILYFGIDPSLQSQGLGTKILDEIKQIYPEQVIIADLEDTTKDAKNLTQRKKRINFYSKNGFKPSIVSYHWQEDDYIIFEYNGTITKHEFGEFWRHY